jgi:murein DD-endopeptidase MepM/ murein hydrolase activator NlpD
MTSCKFVKVYIFNKLFFILILALIFSINFSGNSAKANIYQIEKDINKSLEASAKLTSEKNLLQEKITELQIKINDKKRILLKRARAIAYIKKFQWGALLSKLETPNQLERNLKIVKDLNQYDLELFKDFNASRRLLLSSQQRLSQNLVDISNNIKKLKSQQIQLLVSEKKTLEVLKKTNQASLLNLKGELARPIEGFPTWTFGKKIDQSNQYIFVSKGLLFELENQKEIRAIGPGVIIFRDQIDHWRETLIVEHADHYYSVYSGVNQNNRNVNEKVELGETLGMANTNEFYFELRHFDNPINPKLWFKEIK